MACDECKHSARVTKVYVVTRRRGPETRVPDFVKVMVKSSNVQRGALLSCGEHSAGLKLMVLSVFSPAVSGFFCMIIMHSSIEHLGSIMTPHLSETLSVFSLIFDPSVCGHRNSQLQSTGLQRELLQTGRPRQQVCQLLLDIH